MNAHCINVFYETYRDHLIFGITDNFQFKFFPAQHGFFDQNLICHTCSYAASGYCTKFFNIVNKTAACSSHGVCRTYYNRVTKFFRNFFRILDAVNGLIARHFNPESIHGFLKCCTVFPALNGVNVNSDDLNAVFFENARFCQLG